MNNLFQWHGPAVKKLLGWKQGDEEEKWAERAVDSLVKKLKKKKREEGTGTVEDLEWALANPTQHSKCVTIPKSLDGRLQVSHKKGLPHVIYCRVWRWPDLQSHQELRPIAECVFPYDSRAQHICVNPYHYQRVDTRMFSPPSNYSPDPIDVPSGSYPNAANSWCDTQSGASTSSPPFYSDTSSISHSIHSGNSGMSAHSPNSYTTAHSPSALSDDEENCMRVVQVPSPIQRLMPQPHFWATIGYYELNTRVGELFKLPHKEVIVDGFTDPSNSDARICLGLLSNVNRNTTIEHTRRHIGRGIRLIYTHDLNLEITNLSNSPIFVQSRNCNLKLGMSPTTVIRIPPGSAPFCIFDNGVFSNMLQSARQAGYNHLYDLQKMCFIRMSFVKGWGPDYQRQDVTSTPCWIELQLHNPLAWIDSCLNSAGKPMTDATSVS